MLWKDNGGGDYEQAPVGTHIARCVRLIDIGTQEGEYEGRKNSRRQVVVGWELPDELMTKGESAGQPFLVTRFYTQSLGEKATLRKDLVTWRGRDFTPDELEGFDAKNILGVACLLSITANDNGKSRVSGVMKLPKGTKAPDQINPTLYFSLEPGEFDATVFEGLSEGYKKMIRQSPEYREFTSDTTAEPWPDEEPDLSYEEGGDDVEF